MLNTNFPILSATTGFSNKKIRFNDSDFFDRAQVICELIGDKFFNYDPVTSTYALKRCRNDFVVTSLIKLFVKQRMYYCLQFLSCFLCGVSGSTLQCYCFKQRRAGRKLGFKLSCDSLKIKTVVFLDFN